MIVVRNRLSIVVMPVQRRPHEFWQSMRRLRVVVIGVVVTGVVVTGVVVTGVVVTGLMMIQSHMHGDRYSASAGTHPEGQNESRKQPMRRRPHALDPFR